MFAKVNGVQIAYTDEGEGLPLLFIHGFPLNRGTWSHQVEAFKAKHRVIAPDLRGFGESQASPGPMSMSRFAEDIWGLLQHLDVGPVILAGQSMGGYIALAFARAYPKLLRGLMLVGTKAGPDPAEVAETRRATAEKVRQTGNTLLLAALAPYMLSAANADEAMAASVRALMASASPEGIRSALLGMADRPDLRAWLGKIRVPTLVIAGSDDKVISPAEAEMLAKAIPEAQLRVIPHAGHLVEVEQPEAFNEAMRNWLAWGCADSKHARRTLHLPLAPPAPASQGWQQLM